MMTSRLPLLHGLQAFQAFRAFEDFRGFRAFVVLPLYSAFLFPAHNPFTRKLFFESEYGWKAESMRERVAGRGISRAERSVSFGSRFPQTPAHDAICAHLPTPQTTFIHAKQGRATCLSILSAEENQR